MPADVFANANAAGRVDWRPEPFGFAPVGPGPEEEDAGWCRRSIQGGSKSFYAASLLLPRRIRGPAYALYAFCRTADDAVDETGGPGMAARLAARLQRLAAGAPADHPADRAFATVMARHRLPVEIPAALIEGLAWDEQGRRYETLADVEAYAARVAATVGVMMTLIMGERRPEVLARACDLGVAMQLTNIARDVGTDAAMGRLYLPRGWLRAEGIDPEAWLAAPAHEAAHDPAHEAAYGQVRDAAHEAAHGPARDAAHGPARDDAHEAAHGPAHEPALGRVVLRLLTRAEALYDRALPGIAALPRDCRVGIMAARALYREIGRTVAAAGGDGVTARAVVGKRRKAALMAGALLEATLPPLLTGARVGLRETTAAEPLPATRFLVEAVERADAQSPGLRALEDRLGRALDVFVTASLHISAQGAGSRLRS
ncbi:MAG: phytoene/squalene synthase family protein [Pseudomonadota bacterium]